MRRLKTWKCFQKLFIEYENRKKEITEILNHLKKEYKIEL
jgi:hypothetical protein